MSPLFSDLSSHFVQQEEHILPPEERTAIPLAYTNFTYGEIEEQSFFRFLQKLPAAPETFLDLGCGRGKALAVALISGRFQRCVGIEVVPARFRQAMQTKEALARLHLDCTRLELYEKDLRYQSPPKEPCCIYCCAVCYDEPLLQAVQKFAESSASGSQLLLVDRILTKTSLIQTNTASLPMSWGKGKIAVYSN